MASTPSQALTKRSSDNALMPPPPPPKRIKRPATVLDEDIYTNALSQIIARDFFPGLLETQIKQEYLDAVESKDKAWIASAKKKLNEVMASGRDGSRSYHPLRTPRHTPRQGMTMSKTPTTGLPGDTPTGWGGDTPMSVAASTTSLGTQTTDATTMDRKEIPDVSNLGLVAFQAKYTSEDNESFNALLDKQNAKRREKHAWLWSGNKIPSARQIAHRQREAKRIADQGGLKSSIADDDKQLAIKTDLDARPANADSWKARPENSLMFIPSSVEDTLETVQQRAEAASRAGPKRVLYQNTRLQDVQVEDTGRVPPSPSISAIKDAIAGRPRLTESEAGYTGGETPRVNGYAFVDEDDPESAPRSGRGVLDDEDESLDLRLLGSGDSTPNPFQIKENRRREDLHHRMVDRVARNKRAEKAGREIKTTVPRFPSSPRLDFGLRTPGGSGGGASSSGRALTPAAQKLLQEVGSTPRHMASSSSLSGLKNMWTPMPKRGK